MRRGLGSLIQGKWVAEGAELVHRRHNPACEFIARVEQITLVEPRWPVTDPLFKFIEPARHGIEGEFKPLVFAQPGIATMFQIAALRQKAAAVLD